MLAGLAAASSQKQVAVGDAVAAGLRAAMVIVLNAERPGLFFPDLLGVCLTGHLFDLGAASGHAGHGA